MQDISLEKLSLIGYDKINQSDEKEKTVHFFLDDYRFESIYKNPNDKIERLKKFNAVMSPDFSMFTGYVLPREKGGGSAGGIGAGNPKPGGNIPKVPLDDLPENVKRAYIEYEKVGWKGNYKGQTVGTSAGGKYSNREGKLPSYNSKHQRLDYREYDVNSRPFGGSRDNERLVRDNDGDVYYSPDHYETFIEVEQEGCI